jgi:adenylyl cyclase-associated protein
MKALKQVFNDLGEWCKEEMTTGLTWKAGGTPAVEYFAAHPLGSGGGGGGAAPKGKGKGAPPMPKGGLAAPPPEGVVPKAAAAPAAAAGGMSAVFSQLQGVGSDERGLKKVTDDMKTKNRDPSDKPAVVKPKAAPAPKAPAGGGRNVKGPRGPPIIELQKGTNWMIENQEGGTHVLEEGVDQTHLVVIINCRNITVKLPKKVKNICVDGCHKIALIASDVVSSIEAVNSERLQLQTLGKVNSFAIDKCDGVNIWLSKESLGADITSSKSSEMNVTIPDPNGEDGDIIEQPIPEQFVTRLVGKKLQTTVSDLYSS